MSDGSDIGFGIFLKTKMGERQRAGEMTEVLANQRYNAHLVPEDGTLTCSDPGICKSLSWLEAPALAVCLGGPSFSMDLRSHTVRTRSGAPSVSTSLA